MDIASQLIADDAEELHQKELRGAARKAAQTFTWGSLVPFVALVAIMALSGRGGTLFSVAVDSLKTWAVVSLTFLGGVRWGLALGSDDLSAAPRTFAVAGIPALAGWASLFVPEPASFAILAVVFSALGAWDAITGHAGKVASWYADIRIPGTMVSVACLIAALFLAG